MLLLSLYVCISLYEISQVYFPPEVSLKDIFLVPAAVMVSDLHRKSRKEREKDMIVTPTHENRCFSMYDLAIRVP